jgi:hypothetical protein
MNERDEAIESTETRKKRRRSGFRYSSKKVLECSRVKRETAKVGGVQFKSVTRTLSYPSEIDQVFQLALIVLRNLMEIEWS